MCRTVGVCFHAFYVFNFITNITASNVVFVFPTRWKFLYTPKSPDIKTVSNTHGPEWRTLGLAFFFFYVTFCASSPPPNPPTLHTPSLIHCLFLFLITYSRRFQIDPVKTASWSFPLRMVVVKMKFVTIESQGGCGIGTIDWTRSIPIRILCIDTVLFFFVYLLFLERALFLQHLCHYFYF